LVNRQIRFPVELWVAICGLLSPKDQHSLAESCRRLFSIVRLNPPPTVVKIDDYHVRSTGWERKDLLHLRSATEVHWSASKRDSVVDLQLHAVLSVLPIIPNIQLLSLHNADINEAQQAIIFGLSTLRTLAVYFCSFHSSTNPMPDSHVTSLKLLRNDTQTTRHLLAILAATVEELEVDGSAVGLVRQGGLIHLPKLSTFTSNHPDPTSSRAILNAFKRYTSITTLNILFRLRRLDMSLHHSDFPALRSLTCRHRLAVGLIPERPVTSYVEVYYGEGGPWELLDTLSKTRAGITNLKLCIPDNFCSRLLSLLTSLRHLEQLTLKLYSPNKGVRLPDYLSGQPVHNLPGAEAMVLPKLKRVTIYVDDNQYTSFSPEWLLNECFGPVCLALEEFEYLYLAVSSSSFQFYRFPEPTRAWMMRRLPDGSWERQGPPPIPIPTPARTLHVAL